MSNKKFLKRFIKKYHLKLKGDTFEKLKRNAEIE